MFPYILTSALVFFLVFGACNEFGWRGIPILIWEMIANVLIGFVFVATTLLVGYIGRATHALIFNEDVPPEYIFWYGCVIGAIVSVRLVYWRERRPH